jgi:hypothetical protein
MDLAIRVLVLALILYPIWAIPLSIIISAFFANKFQRLSFLNAWLTIFIINMILFFPVVLGGEGFSMMGPWYMKFFDIKHASFSLDLSLISIAIFSLLCFLFVNYARKEAGNG